MLEEEDMPYCLVLGSNAIRQLNIRVNIKAKQISFACNDERFMCPCLDSGDQASSNHCPAELCLVQTELESESDEIDDLATLSMNPISLDQAIAAQQGNYTTKLLYNKVVTHTLPKYWRPRCLQQFTRYASKMRVLDGCLWFDQASGPVIIVPFKFLTEIMHHLHNHMTHAGRNKLIKATQSIVWHPAISTVAADICSSCMTCQCSKILSTEKNPPVLKIQAHYPFDLICADLLQLPKTTGGYIGCLMVVDHFSKWLVAVPIRNKRADTIASVFEHAVLPSLPAKPHRILTDNGSEFSAASFNEILQKYDIKHIYSTPFHPASNGAVERINRTVVQMLRCSCTDPADWATRLPQVVLNYNHSWHSALNMTPSQCIMTRSYSRANSPWMSAHASEEWKAGHPRFSPFKVGQRVLRKVQQLGHLTRNKLVDKYEGPYDIRTVHDNGVSYEIQQEEGPFIKAHHTQLKPFVAPPEYLKAVAGKTRLDSGTIPPLVQNKLPRPRLNYSSDSSDCSGGAGLPALPLSSFSGSLFSGFESESDALDFAGDPSQSAYIQPVQMTAAPVTPLASAVKSYQNSTALPVYSQGDTPLMSYSGELKMNEEVSLIDSAATLSPPIDTLVAGCPEEPAIHMPEPCSVALELSSETNSTSHLGGFLPTLHSTPHAEQSAEEDDLLNIALTLIEEQHTLVQQLDSHLSLLSVPDCDIIATTTPNSDKYLSLHSSVLAVPATTADISVQPMDQSGPSEDSQSQQSVAEQPPASEMDAPFEGFNTGDFSGFTGNLSTPRLHLLRAPERRLSLSPVKNQLAEARRTVTYFRKRAEARRFMLLNKYRTRLSDAGESSLHHGNQVSDISTSQVAPASQVSSIEENLPEQRNQISTRSRGPVPTYDNVQKVALEYCRSKE